MQTNLRTIRKYRRYSEEFKKQLVSEYESGKYSVGQLGKLHSIDCKLIYHWIYKFSTFNEKGYRVVEMEESSSKKFGDMAKRIKELEGIVGRKQIQIDYLEKMIDLAKEEYNIDIKKNSCTPQSTGSRITKNK